MLQQRIEAVEIARSLAGAVRGQGSAAYGEIRRRQQSVNGFAVELCPGSADQQAPEVEHGVAADCNRRTMRAQIDVELQRKDLAAEVARAGGCRIKQARIQGAVTATCRQIGSDSSRGIPLRGMSAAAADRFASHNRHKRVQGCVSGIMIPLALQKGAVPG